MTIKNIFKRLGAALYGFVEGLFIWLGVTLAAIPITMLFTLTELKSPFWLKILSGTGGFLAGAIATPFVFVIGTFLPFMMAVSAYKKERTHQQILKINDGILNFLQDYKNDPTSAALTEENIKEFEAIIQQTQNKDDAISYQKLLDAVKGSGAQTPIDLDDFYSLKNPITITQHLKIATGEKTMHEQIYSHNESRTTCIAGSLNSPPKRGQVLPRPEF